MRITDEVDIPDELIAAATDGDLVLFVGAGVSMNAPSNLPSFTELVTQIAESIGASIDKQMEPDAAIGRLCNSDPSARAHLREVIADIESQPNDTHRAIVRLGNACGSVRIVSTNYDEHLCTAAGELSIELGDTYMGPAVPLGRNFTGLVYLHGRISRDLEDLVITDEDFGRAYLFDGWARRFVTDLFLTRTVLFIGYSHDDAVMKYLARGLPPSTKRFALTSRPCDRKWKDLRITPVEYSDKSNHAALPKALNAWAQRLEMKQLDHSARVKEIAAGGPPKVPVEDDYLASTLSTPAGVRAFSEIARGHEWLPWIEQLPAFLSLFDPHKQCTDTSQILAQWFANNYAADITLSDLALATLARHGPVVNARLLEAIAFAAFDLRDISTDLSTKWSTIATHALRTHHGTLEPPWGIAANASLSNASVLPLLRQALQPRLQLRIEQPWYLDQQAAGDRVKIDIRWAGSDHDLEELLERAWKSPSIDATSVLQIVEQCMTDAHELLAACGINTPGANWSYRRSAIEPHEQDSAGYFEDTLIDALRDASTELMNVDHSIMLRWLHSEFVLFRRIGLHLVTENSALSVDEKLDLFLQGPHLYDLLCKHETFRLLATVAPDLDENGRRLLLSHVLEGPPQFKTGKDEEGVLHDRWIFDIVDWLSRYVSGWSQVDESIDAILHRRPMFQARNHPDFNSWMESGWVEDKAPFTAQELIDTYEQHGPKYTISTITEQDYETDSFDGPTWRGASNTIRDAVKNRPEVGLGLLEEAALFEPTSQTADFDIALIAGLSEAELDNRHLQTALHYLSSLAPRRQLARALSDFCLSVVSKKETQLFDCTMQQVDDLAEQLVENHIQDEEGYESDDWLMLGLNRWPGVLTQYWIERIRFQWKVEGSNWQGIPSTAQNAIMNLLKANSQATRPSKAIISSEAYFIFGADSDFATNTVFPLFAESLGEPASQAWKSYLNHPRVDDAMLDSGFWKLLSSARNQVSMLDPDSHETRQYWQLIALVCLRSSSEIVDATAFFDLLSTTDQRCAFIDALAELFSQIDEAEAAIAWNTWVSTLARARLDRSISTVSAQERTCWGDMALGMPASLSIEALEISDKSPGPLGNNSTLVDLPSGLLEAHSDWIAGLIIRRLELMTQSDWSIARELERFAYLLRQNGAQDETLNNLAERALTIGIHTAIKWV
ncbi:SIR2 family protein [Brevibacterium oceani]|uniref:SIR2 family protein n=1 Tax=Brevibacterium oceani TaxID=358099 RepID=UPI001B33BE64|nr:SIR2 family protein [Brevibacterium oceani]